MEAFIHGFVLAFGLILPLGVQNVFVFNQGANQPNLWRALPVVITASLCDTTLIILAVLGVSMVVLKMVWLKTILFVVGVIFLMFMGWSTWKSTFETGDTYQDAMPPTKQIIFSASVSLLNPHAIIDTVGVIGTNSLNYVAQEKWMFTIATILVSWIWFLGLALLGRIIGDFDQKGNWIKYLNKASALIIWGTAGYIALSAFNF